MPMDQLSLFTAGFGHAPMPLTAAATLLQAAVYFGMVMKAGQARGTFKIDAPATDGPVAFQSVLRVQQNTVEQWILHLPLLWIAAFAMGDAFAAVLGAVWAIGRVMYARGYYADPKKRHTGFVIGALVNLALFAACLASVVASL